MSKLEVDLLAGEVKYHKALVKNLFDSVSELTKIIEMRRSTISILENKLELAIHTLQDLAGHSDEIRRIIEKNKLRERRINGHEAFVH